MPKLMKLNLMIAFATAPILLGCSHTGPQHQPQPDWVHSPGNGVTTSAGRHPDGLHAQEQLAISRARAELAKQLKVRISGVSMIHDIDLEGANPYTIAESISIESLNENEVRAIIKEKWMSPDGRLYIWLTPIQQ